MEIHNIAEDIVFAKVAEIFDTIAKEDKQDNYCTCNQCRLDTACYVLNRTGPRYILSNRGVARAEMGTIERQQLEADIAALVYEGLKRINHNQRPNFSHISGKGEEAAGGGQKPVFNIPTIIGRLFNGANFAPLSDVQVELLHNGELLAMKSGNWQNPYTIVDKTEGTFTFWPEPVPADSAGLRRFFEFSVRVEASGFDLFSHHFKIPVTSEPQTAAVYSMDRTFRLPDLYMFPPGGEEEDF